MKRTLRNQAVVIASERGYFVNGEGCVRCIINGFECVVPVFEIGHHRKRPSIYWYFTVWSPKHKKNLKVMVHKLAAYQKYGKRVFRSALLVRHLDNNHANNRPDNLRLGTRSQNAYDRPREHRVADAARAKKTKEAKYSGPLLLAG